MASALSGQKREVRDWLLEAGLESATKRGRAANDASLSRATIRYAVDCIENGERALALEVIAESDLKSEQKDFIRNAIKALGETAIKVRELSRFENKLMSLVQPATYAFLNDANLVGMVTNYFCYPIKSWNLTPGGKTFMQAALSLSIEQAPAAVKQAILRQDLAVVEKFRRLQIVFYQAHLEHPLTKKPLQLEEVLALCDAFVELELENKGDLDGMAEALNKCPHTKFRAVRQVYVMEYASLEEIIKLPFLQELDVRMNYYAEEQLDALQGCNLRKLSIGIRDDDLTDDQVDSLSQMPFLEDLMLDSHNGALRDKGLEKLSSITTLKVLDIREADGVSDSGLDNLLERDSQIKLVRTPFSAADVKQLQKKFPDVVIEDRKRQTYQEKHGT